VGIYVFAPVSKDYFFLPEGLNLGCTFFFAPRTLLCAVAQ
jgi:hypothetical protein